MADTVDTAVSVSPADEPEKPDDAAPADEPEKPQSAAPADGPQELQDAAPADVPQEPRDAAPADETEEPQDAPPADEAGEPEDARSISELFEQLGRDMSDLGKSEAQLEAARNMPEVRASARDISGALVVAVAALTAFAFLNVAAADGLSRALATWQAALVLAAVWIVVGGMLLFGLMGRARRWLFWLLLKEPSTKDVDELQRERDSAAEAARSTLELLGPALLIRIALAAVPEAGDVASGVVEAGDNVLDASDEIVADFTEEIPGGGAVRQVWAVALMPGRLGIRVATTVLRRRRPED